ncbi:barstar family protein [Chryseobacterium gwangjuense]|uniref:barstar family protein n=1 Tax=Chryseobacterium gwangjuense TaxID=1069980 RepID=UPI001E2AC5C5|nr:barstar family protein [Chryseobacterium gwangjuense]MCE3076514.1 barstar family protein [Chryseobacterium gwangjuense]
MFGFALDTLEKPQIIAFIENVKNLENNKTNIGYRELRLINIENPSLLKSEIEKSIKTYDNQGFISLLNSDNSLVCSTFISNIKIIKSQKNNMTLSGYVWHQPKGYYKVWKMKIDDQINSKNIWRNLKRDELQGWLVFALNNLKTSSSKKNIQINIDGNDFNNLNEFFCVLGEEVNGIAGYFGRNICALYDCLWDNSGDHSIEKLIWKNHEKSKKLFKTKFNQILEIFQEFNVTIILK